MEYVWIIDNKLAVSPMPRASDLDELSRVFNSAIVLIEPDEACFSGIDAYLNEWVSRGVNVYYAPTPDFHPVDLLELYCISKWIDEEISRDGRVITHCYGGIGRSGMVAAAYLIYKGFGLDNAIDHVRNRRPGAVEAISQYRVLEDYYVLLRTIDRNVFDKHVGFVKSRSDKRLWKHLSKTLQLLLELHNHLNLAVSSDLIYAALYHCFNNGFLNTLKDNIVERDILDLLGNDSLEQLLIRLSHTLDYSRDSRVVYTDSYVLNGRTVIELYCETECSDILDKTGEYTELLSKQHGLLIEFDEKPYYML